MNPKVQKIMEMMAFLFVVFLWGGAGAETEMLVLNVRKADCILLKSGNEQYMIDTGTAQSWGQISASLKAEGIDHLTGVILTHTDSDHVGSVDALAGSGIKIDGWYASCFYTCKANKHPAVIAAGKRGEHVTFLKAGDQLPLGDGTLKVLGPIERDPDKENNNSLVLLADTPDGTILLAGDMEFPEENSLLKAGVLAPVDVLKVGNHGESDASGEVFIQTVSPTLAVISTHSADEPDTPFPRVLQDLKNVGAEILLTENTEMGIRVILREGHLETRNDNLPVFPDKTTGVRILEKNQENDSVTLINEGNETIDLSDWFLLSERGGELFVFPKDTVIRAGQKMTLTTLSSKTQGDLVWQEKKVWHKSKKDCAVLYDEYGRMISYEY